MKKKVFNFLTILVTILSLAAIIWQIFSLRPVALSSEHLDIPASEKMEVEWIYEEEGNN